MNTIQSRFASVEALRHSDVDVHALKAHGRIEVNGKQYEIRAAADGKLAVSKPDKQAMVDKFFSGTSHLLGGQSQRSQIAQVLNEKAAATPSAPRLERMLGKRFDVQQARIEQGQSSSAASAVTPDSGVPQGKEAFASLYDWAKKAKKLKEPTKQDIYDIFKEAKPTVTPMNRAEQDTYLMRLRRINAHEGVSVSPQSMDGLNKEYRLLGPFIKENPNARKEFYRITPEPVREKSETMGRLTIGVQPQYASQLIKAMGAMVKNEDSIFSGKVDGPERYGSRTDSAILYVKGDFQQAQELGQKLKSLSGLPPEAFISHTPPGMQALDKGLSYAETVRGQSSSHGDSRSAIILDALHRKGGSLESRLKEALVDKGYNPENPAFRRTL
ncbi:T3SS effector HopA1 family protein [Pseudomonas sp. NPDC089734]|uniref:T3SS effector HopA1 family protein n=1 Tax=Pseudomonas sp. NPDC089734 TaxID=3364469 RepID=UPI00380489C1